MSYMAICEKYSERGYEESQAMSLAFCVGAGYGGAKTALFAPRMGFAPGISATIRNNSLSFRENLPHSPCSTPI